jgi:hypothetical protein
MENVGIFYGHLEYFTAIWYILWPFGNLLYNFPLFGILCEEKSGNPGSIGSNVAAYKDLEWTKQIEKRAFESMQKKCILLDIYYFRSILTQTSAKTML